MLFQKTQALRQRLMLQVVNPLLRPWETVPRPAEVGLSLRLTGQAHLYMIARYPKAFMFSPGSTVAKRITAVDLRP